MMRNINCKSAFTRFTGKTKRKAAELSERLESLCLSSKFSLCNKLYGKLKHELRDSAFITDLPEVEISSVAQSIATYGKAFLGDDGDIYVWVVVTESMHPSFSISNNLRVSGRSIEGLRFSGENGVITSSSPQGVLGSPEKGTLLKICLKSCKLSDGSRNVAGGWSKRVLSLKNCHVFGGAKASLDGFRVSLRGGSNPASPYSESVLIIENPRSDSTDAKPTIERMKKLLTLAQRRPVVAFREEVFSGKTLLETSVISNRWIFERHSPMFPEHAKQNMDFIRVASPKYLSESNHFGLDRLVEYYWRSHTETTIEMKFVLASILMETAKFFWALNASPAHHADRKANGLVRLFYKKQGRPPENKPIPESFENILKDMVNTWGYAPPGGLTFIENRNSLFHAGQSTGDQLGEAEAGRLLAQELYKLYDQIDDILLRILGYSGEYFSVRDPNLLLDFPTRTLI